MTIWSSPPLAIGKHEWRARVYQHDRYGPCLTYQWRPADPIKRLGYGDVDGWSDMCRWPRYNHNNGETAGCPKNLRKLYDQHRDTIRDLCRKETGA